jgi:hypothetical protein
MHEGDGCVEHGLIAWATCRIVPEGCLRLSKSCKKEHRNCELTVALGGLADCTRGMSAAFETDTGLPLSRLSSIASSSRFSYRWKFLKSHTHWHARQHNRVLRKLNADNSCHSAA